MTTNHPLADHLSPMDRRYATGTSRHAFDRARYAMNALAAGDKKLAAYHKRGVIEHARFLEAGLTRIAARLAVQP